jgi:hypothetical protein
LSDRVTSAARSAAGRKLIGIVLNELNPTVISRQRDQQHA